MSTLDLLFGRPLTSSDEHGQRIGPSAGIPIFGLDALSSAAYGPEAALTLLIPLGLGGVHYIVPISIAILALLVIVYFSYLQTIDAYPQGGGSYTVATENLGPRVGLFAAAALMIDYILTAAVGISAGVGALVSAVPSLQPHTLAMCLFILILLAVLNLRGVREAGVAFMVPTYLFVGALLFVIVMGLARFLISGGHPTPVVTPPVLPPATTALSYWLLLKVFSSGCTALTGIEAVSNGVTTFREPTTKNAKKTLTFIISLLVVLLLGIAMLCRAYHVGATEPGSAGYESILSILTAAVAGKGVFYYVTIGSILLVLSLSANTAFVGFPRLTRIISQNNYLPHVFMIRGRRLLFSHGIAALVFFTAVLLILFQGVTDRLIPLYAIGAFLAFTLSQAGMVVHWYKQGNATGRMIVNGIGAFATGATLLVVLVAKFRDGAWVTALLIPALILIMTVVRKHYERTAQETANPHPLRVEGLQPPMVIMPIDKWNHISESGLRFAMAMSPDVQAVHVDCGDEDDSICHIWEDMVAKPVRAAGLPEPQLITVKSPYRFFIQPVVDHVLAEQKKAGDRQIAVLVPELVVKHWYENLLHNQRANMLKLILLVKGKEGIVVVNIPWYLH